MIVNSNTIFVGKLLTLFSKCIHSALIPQIKEEMLSLIELVKPNCSKIDYNEWKYDTQQSFTAIKNFQRQLRRDFVQSSDWDGLYDKMDPSIGLTTVGKNDFS